MRTSFIRNRDLLIGNGDLEMTDITGKEFKQWKVFHSIQKQAECFAWRGAIFALGTRGGLYKFKYKHSLSWVFELFEVNSLIIDHSEMALVIYTSTF